MSYIDTFDHEFVGFLGGLPLYHPTEIVQGTELPTEFACSPSNLILGGGDGEHPALLFIDLGATALYFLRFSLELQPGKRDLISLNSLEKLDELPPVWNCMQFAGWNLETFSAFYRWCLSPNFPTPFVREEHGTIEEWLLYSLGEFIYFSLPELAEAPLIHVADLSALVQEPKFFNVTIAPPGYKVRYGRYRTSLGKVIWGNYPWMSKRNERSLDGRV